MAVDLATEYEAPAKLAPPTATSQESVNLSAEFEPPPRQEQHAIINDAAEKAHQWKRAFDPSVPKEQQTQAARDIFSQMLDSLGSHILPETKKTLTQNWEDLNTPMVNLPQAPEATEEERAKYPAQPLIAGAYNGAAKVVSGLTTPLNIVTLGTFGALTKVAQGIGPAATMAKHALTLIKGAFAAETAKGAGGAAGAASVPAGKSTQEETSDVVEALTQSALAGVAAHSATVDALTPSAPAKGKAVNPNAVNEAIGRQTDAKIAEADRLLTAQEIERQVEAKKTAPVDIGTRDSTVSTGMGVPTPKEVEMLAEQKRLVDEHLAKTEKNTQTLYHQTPEKFDEIKPSIQSGGYIFFSDKPDVLTKMRKAGASEEFTKKRLRTIKADVTSENPLDWTGFSDDYVTAEGWVKKLEDAGVTIPDNLRQKASSGSRLSVAPWEVLRVGGEDLKNAIRSAGYDSIKFKEWGGDTTAVLSGDQVKIQAKPKLSDEFTPPPAGSEAHTVITEELAQQPETPPSAEPVKLADELTPPEGGPTGIRNAIVDQERKDRGLPPAMETAAKEFGTVWNEALKRVNDNPNAAIDLVTEIRDKPRALTDEENALLLHRQIDLQNQFDKVNDRLVNGAEDATPEQRASDTVQQARLLDDLQDIYDVGRKAGTESGRGLNARKMLANEDFSLAKMLVTRRAVNDGAPLSEAQTAEVQSLHEKIASTQKAFDDYVKANNERLAKMEKTQPGTRNTDRNVVSKFIAEKAVQARERIAARRAEGRLYAGIDPEVIGDYAIIGAEHLAKGVEDFGAWSAEMVKEFGDVIKPHLVAIRTKAEELLKTGKSQETRLKSFKTRAENRAEAYQQRLEEGDLGPLPKPEPLRLDEEARKLQATAERAKMDFQEALIKDRLANRTTSEKAQDTFVKWRRGFLLSGPGTLAKLTAAAANRLVQTPIEEAVGAGIGKLIPKVAEKASLEGGFNVDAEAKAITGLLIRGMEDAKTTLLTGKSDLDVLYGRGRGSVRPSDVAPRSVIDFFGQIHGALKAPVKRAAFERYLEKETAFQIRQGTDVTDPMVQAQMMVKAYKYAQRSIFMQDNVVTEAWNAGLSRLERVNPKTGEVSGPGKATATLLRTLLPIVKVPTNIVAETFETATGSVTGSIKLAQAIRAGTEKLTPEQADIIMRQLKKGSLGAALLALGYFNPENAGGYYQQGDKRKAGDVKPAMIRLYGVDVPSILIHNPAVETLQLGATIRRVADAKIHGKEKGLSSGIPSALLGLAEELPFVKTPIELGKLIPENTRTRAAGDLARGFVVPEAVQAGARFMDKDAEGNPIRRNPKTVLENVETGIPGLRETVRKK